MCLYRSVTMITKLLISPPRTDPPGPESPRVLHAFYDSHTGREPERSSTRGKVNL